MRPSRGERARGMTVISGVFFINVKHFVIFFTINKVLYNFILYFILNLKKKMLLVLYISYAFICSQSGSVVSTVASSSRRDGLS